MIPKRYPVITWTYVFGHKDDIPIIRAMEYAIGYNQVKEFFLFTIRRSNKDSIRLKDILNQYFPHYFSMFEKLIILK